MTTTRRNTSTKLVLALCSAALLTPAFPASTALAQDVDESTASDAETAFLKAYYLETGLRDLERATAAYARVIAEHPDAGRVTAGAMLGWARCQRTLKDAAIATSTFEKVRDQFPGTPEAKQAEQELAARSTPAAARDETALANLVLGALNTGNGESAASFGDRGVPFVAEKLRDANPTTVYRAAHALVAVDSELSRRTLTQAFRDERVLYPAQLSVSNIPLNSELQRAAVESPIRALSDRAIAMALAAGTTSTWLTERVVADAELRAKYLTPETDNVDDDAYPHIVAAALRSDIPDVRRAAIEALLATTSKSSQRPRAPEWNVLMSPDERTLADQEAVRAMAHVMGDLARWTLVPAEDLLHALLKDEKTARVGAMLLAKGGSRGPTPDAGILITALEGLSSSSFSGAPSPAAARVVFSALGREPAAADLARLGLDCVPDDDFHALVYWLLDRDRLTREGALAMQSGLAGHPRKHTELLKLLSNSDYKATTAEWASELFVRGLRSDDLRVKASAVAGLAGSTAQGGVDLGPHLKNLGAMLDSPDLDLVKRALTALRAAGPAGMVEVSSRLSDECPHVDLLLRALNGVAEPSTASALRAYFGATREEHRWMLAAATIFAIEGDGAEAWAREAIDAGPGARTTMLVDAISFAAAHIPSWSAERMLLRAVQQAPGRIDWEASDPQAFEPSLPIDVIRKVALAALASAAVTDRRWGAKVSRALLDVTAWDALVTAAADLDSEVRDDARSALRSIREAEQELAEFRAEGEMRKTRLRIDELLASEDTLDRRGGVAAIVAVGDADTVQRLVKIAADDPDEQVREDARKGLMAIGARRTGSSPPSEPK